jgi:hypothetical protein
MIPLLILPIVAEASDIGTSRPLTDAETIERIPLPPIRFRGDITVVVHFVEPSKLPALCGVHVEVGFTLLGCARANPGEMFVSNPCLSLDQLYAKELCHEASHSAGWPSDHGP